VSDRIQDLAELLLDCLCSKLAVRPNPPAQCCLRFGTDVPQDVLPEDVCCQGLGFVRLGQMFASSQNFPEPDVPDNCAGQMWAVELEMGVLRCGNPTECEDWTSGSVQHFSDRWAMVEAICCFRDRLMAQSMAPSILIGEGQPLAVEGNCAGATQTITVQIPGPCCV